MRGGGSYRGGRGGYNNGGSQGYNNFAMGASGPSDTLNIRVSEVQQPVTEDDMRKVFDRAGVAPRSIQIYPTPSPSETIVVVQFPDQFAAENVMSNLNNRNIYTNANKMNMSYAAPTAGSGGSILSGSGGAVLSAPGPMFPAVGAPQQQQQQVYAPMPQAQPQPTMMMQPQMPYGNPMMMMDPMAVMAGGMGGGRGMRGVSRGGRGGSSRGGRGASVGSMGFDPMMMGFNPMGMPMGMPMTMGMPMGMPMGRGGRFNNNGMMSAGGPRGAGTTVYLSVTVVPTTEPLQPVFTLLEAFGGVVSMRRNHNKKEILTVKMASIDDAEAAVRHMRRVPFSGGTVSAIRFPNYLERNPCTDEGNPTDPETVQFDFTASRHRSPGQRSKANPSKHVKITGCSAYVESDIMTYLNDKNFFADSITKEEDGSFRVIMPDTETAVKVLITCHGDVCGEERSNVIFVEDPEEVAAQAAAAAQKASETAALGNEE